jgi:hypothetical protein
MATCRNWPCRGITEVVCSPSLVQMSLAATPTDYGPGRPLSDAMVLIMGSH